MRETGVPPHQARAADRSELSPTNDASVKNYRIRVVPSTLCHQALMAILTWNALEQASAHEWQIVVARSEAILRNEGQSPSKGNSPNEVAYPAFQAGRAACSMRTPFPLVIESIPSLGKWFAGVRLAMVMRDLPSWP